MIMKLKRSESTTTNHRHCYFHSWRNIRSIMLISLCTRRFLHGFSPCSSSERLFGRRLAIAASSQRVSSSSSDRSRLSKWDEILFESTSNNETKNHRPIPPNRGFSGNDEEFGAYDYHPGEDDFYDTESLPSEVNNNHTEEIDDLEEEGLSIAKPKASSNLNMEFFTNTTTTEIIPPTQEDDLPSEVSTKIDDVEESVLIAKNPEYRRIDREDLYTRAKNDDSDSGESVHTAGLDQRKKRLDALQQHIYDEHNNGQEFNVNSPKQVSKLLFGTSDQSTNKDALEALAACNNKQLASLADLILQYRRLRQNIRRTEKKESSVETGKHVTSFSITANVSQSKQKMETRENVDDDPLILIDTSAFIYRAYYGMAPLHRKDGMPVGAVLGVCSMLNRITLNRLLEPSKKQPLPPRVILVFDRKGGTFRNDMYPDYKANRPDCPVDLVPQFDLIHDAAKAYGIPELEAAGYEADDVIATLASSALEQGLNTHILSTDKDLMQLVRDQTTESSNYVHMVNPTTMSLIDSESVADKWNVPRPEMVGDLLALAGDASDNIPGVPGIGPKIAASLLQQFDTLENLYQNVESIPQKKRRESLVEHKEKVFLYRKLVELERSIPFTQMTGTLSTFDLKDARMQTLDSDRLFEFYRTMEFTALRRRVEDRLTQKSRKRPVYRKKKKTQVPKPEDYQDVPF